jgi:hypothetical protein
MQASVYARERKHIGSMWSSVTCLALSLAAAQCLGSQVLEDSKSLRRRTIAIQNKRCKQINKQSNKLYLLTKKMVLTYATRRYKHVGARIT